MDRNQLEQEAIRQLNLGSHEGALRAYLQIIRMDPKDRRIRQKVGELYLKLGKQSEAEKQLREVADSLVKEGAHRAAVAVLKQLIGIRADDPGIQFELAECYVASGYANDARTHFDTAMRLWIGVGKAADAAKAARRISELSPGEPALRLKVAELLEAAGDNNGAAAVYQEVADEYRRRGRPDEVGRIAEMALRLRPDDLGLLLDAAAARVDANEPKRALVHLQLAFSQGPREPRTLDLLARALEGVGQPDKALKVLVELGRVSAERADPAMEADALRRAARLAPQDAELGARLQAAEEKVDRLERRLTQLGLAQPTNEAELRAQVRGEVYARYGLFDRAAATLQDALAANPGSNCLTVSLAEVEAARGRKAEAVQWMQALLPRAGGDAAAVADRIAVLGGGPNVEPAAPAASPPPAPEPVVVAPPAVEGPLERGDRLAAADDFAGALAAYREALAADPLDDDVLARIAALRERARAGAQPAPPAPAAPIAAPSFAPSPPAGPSDAEDEEAFADFAPLDDGTFSEVDPDALGAALPDGPDLDEARSLVAVGLWDDALALLEGDVSLESAVLRAQAVKGRGDTVRALDLLREAVNEALESDPAYCDALFELSALYTATGKPRSAVRLLEELKDLDPGYRSGEVDARMRGLARLVK
jgi:tetratricopeptide (TPR) repeat protein